MTPTVWLVRHGATEWSETGRHTSRTDLPLLPAGEAAAEALRTRLSGQSFAAVFTSPLQRARQTCALAGLGGSAEILDDLREWDYGDYEGLTTPEIRADRPGWSLWDDGCPGGEIADAVARRADRVIARLRATPGDVAVFSHGHLSRVLAARWIGADPRLGGHLVLDAGALSILGAERDSPAILLWNERPSGT